MGRGCRAALTASSVARRRAMNFSIPFVGGLLVVAVVALGASDSGRGRSGGAPVIAPKRVEANCVAEIALLSEKTYRNPLTEAGLDAIVTQPDGSQLRVPGFWAGGNRWCFRYASSKLGQAAADQRLHDRKNGQWGKPLGKVAVPDTGSHIRLTAAAWGQYAALIVTDGKRTLATPIVKVTNTKSGKVGLWLFQIGERQEYDNLVVSRAKLSPAKSAKQAKFVPRTGVSCHDPAYALAAHEVEPYRRVRSFPGRRA